MTLTLQDIGLGSSANDGTGDTPRAAGEKINANNAAITAFLKALAALDTVSTAQIDNGAVTLAKMADMADGRILGNNAGVAGPPIALTASQVKTLLAISSSDVSGLGSFATISSLAFSSLTGIPTTVAGYGISDVYTQSQTTALRLSQFAAPNASVSFNSQLLTNLSDPSSAQDAATKNYVDTVAQGLDAKASVKAATTANITLSSGQTIDGVSVTTGDRVLVKNQSTGSQNGIYVVASGSWTRATDMDAWAELPGSYCWVEQGTTNGDTGWVCTNDAGGTLGSTSVAFTQFAGAGSYTATGGITLTGTQFSLSSIADQRIMGNVSGSSAAPIALTASQIKTMLAISVASDISGLGTGVATALAANADSASGFVTQSGGDTRFARLGVGNALNGAQSIAGGTLNGTVLDISQTWGGTGTYTGIKYNVTDSGPANANSLLMDLQVGGTSAFKVRKDGTAFAFTLQDPNATFAVWANNGLVVSNNMQIGFSSTSSAFGTRDVIMSRAAAATLQHGAADAASPVAQTVGVQNVVAGTSNTAGANFKIRGSAGTGNALGGSTILQVAPAGSSGTSQNAWADLLTLIADKTLLLANCVAAPAGTPSGGGYIYVESGALKYKGSSGTVTTLGVA